MKKQQECANHTRWQKQYSIAYWIFLLVGLFLVTFTDRIMAGGVAIAGSMTLYLVSIVLDIRHAKWHVENDKEGENYDFKP